MSKSTSYHVSPSDFERAFGFNHCVCAESPYSIGAQYTIEYETESYSTMLKKITVSCSKCGKSRTYNVQSERIDGSYLPF